MKSVFCLPVTRGWDIIGSIIEWIIFVYIYNELLDGNFLIQMLYEPQTAGNQEIFSIDFFLLKYKNPNT